MSQKPLFSKPVKRQTLAEQMAAAIEEIVLTGELAPGSALPTEPQLAEQFGVSRAVVRDATRILMARGLVDVQHGRGAFVTLSQSKAFAGALLLALRRAGASVWDVEHYVQLILPPMVALAATEATKEDITRLEVLKDEYLSIYRIYLLPGNDDSDIEKELRATYRRFMQGIFAATHNELCVQLGAPLLELRNFRTWGGEELDDAELAALLETETFYFQRLFQAVAEGDVDRAQATTALLVQLPTEAIEAMQQTPVGQVPVIPISPRELSERFRDLMAED